MKIQMQKISGLILIIACLAGCSGKAVETSWKDFIITNFNAVHLPVKGDMNEHLIFGTIPVSKPAHSLSPELAAFLGRWEGYDYSPPVKKDHKGVLVIQKITPRGGKAFLWAGFNLQFPFWVKEIKFKVVPGTTPSIQWQGDQTVGSNNVSGMGTFMFTYDREKGVLKGGINLPGNNALNGPFELGRDQSFYVYQDYAKYLESKRIYPREFLTINLKRYGRGYLLYLPEGYEANSKKIWPLIIFLHGTGDRGDNLFLLAKASPFMIIREKGPLPCIIAAPILNESKAYRSFPQDYMDGALKEILANYRIDKKRIYLTGLSIGGEATYRFALHQPGTFAAIAPLAGFDARYYKADTLSGFVPSAEPPERIKNLPVWAIHGSDDMIVPLAADQKTVDALKKAGVNVRFSILENHDHDVWTDTYSDFKFYDWLFQHRRP